MGKKFYLPAALAALALVSCSDESLIEPTPVKNITQANDNGAIMFGAGANKLTRAGEALKGSEAAEKLGRHFTVIGYKGTKELPMAYKENSFDKYVVTYAEGTAGSTSTNTHDWEYVFDDQIIKYWDYSAPYYNFLAWSIVDGAATVESTLTDGTADNGDKLTFNVPSAKDAQGIFISNRYTATPDGLNNPLQSGTAPDYNYNINEVNGKYNNVVTLNFRSFGAKVRLGIYETIPGYKVNDVVFYEESTHAGYGQNTRVKPVSTGDYKRDRTPNSYETVGSTKNYNKVETYGVCSAVLFAKSVETPFNLSGNFSVTYQNEDNVAVVAPASDNVTAASFAFGTKSRSTELGTTSNTATFWSEDYVPVLPMTGTDLYLKVDYTLTALDGSGENIRVQGATAVVPAQYAEWKSNYAYTYLFKISDKTNGYTGGDTPGTPDDPEEENPTDPTPDDPNNPAGLYPITFDACVINSEDGIQETITTISEPSITTYQFGSKVVANDEYLSADDNVYVNVMIPATAGGAELATLTAGTNAWLYTAYNLGNEDITEGAVANKSSKIALTDVTTSLPLQAVSTADKDVPTVDGYNFDGTDKFLKFAPKAGTVYVFKYQVAAGKFAYKVIKVQGTPAAVPTYTMNAVLDTYVNKYTKVTIKNNGDAVVNCPTGFVITNNSTNEDVTAQFTIEEGAVAGNYKVTPVRCKSNVEYKITFGTTYRTFRVNAISLTLTESSIIANNFTSTTLKIENGNGSPIDVEVSKIAHDKAALYIEKGSNPGEYTVWAKPAATGSYDISYLGTTVQVTVNNYALSFVGDQKYVNLGKNATVVLTVNSAAASGISISATCGSVSDTDTDGKGTFTPSSVGTAELTSGNAKATIFVKNFALTLYNPADHTEAAAIVGTAGTNGVFVQLTDNGAAYNALESNFALTGVTIKATSVKGVYRVTKNDTNGSVTFNYQGQEMCSWTY